MTNASASHVPMQPASLDIWDKKYRLKTKSGTPIDVTVEDTYKRVARALSDLESTPELRSHWYERFLWAMEQGAIPAGRITSNAGAQEYKPETSPINCVVSETIEDSMDSIMAKAHDAALTLKKGSGLGYCFSTLRPRGAFVAGAGASTSGPLSFMDIYDAMCFTVASAGGRRGAQMATFDVSHPDVKDFIKAKREDGRLRQFNLSLLITDEFMEAVEKDQPWPLVFPVNKKEVGEVNLDDPAQVVWREWETKTGYVTRDDGLVACKIYQVIRAKNLWDMIMSSTYDYAEPGFLLIDKSNEFNNNWWCENIRASNPCVPAETWVQTSEGPRQVSDLIGRSFFARVDGADHATTVAGFFRTGTKPILRLKTEEGYNLPLTSNHRIRRVVHLTAWGADTEWCAASALRPGDRVLLNDHRANASWPGPLTKEQGYLLGLLIGDGTLKNDTAILSVWGKLAQMNSVSDDLSPGVRDVMRETLRCVQTLKHRRDFSGWSKITGRNEWRLRSAPLQGLAFEYGMSPGDKIISPMLEQVSSDACRGFLRGFFDADGSVQGSQVNGVSVRLSQSDLPRLEAVQRMLLRLGIPSRIDKNRRLAGERLMPDGKGGSRLYPTKASHDLALSGESLQRFFDQVGFSDTDKMLRLKNTLASYRRPLNKSRFVATIATIDIDGVEDVYDVQVPGVNTFDANGFHAHNCGEQNLPPAGACLLGSINLTHFISNPFTKTATFDFDKYREVVSVFTRMLDNVVEINGLPLEKQRHEITHKRRHGMGFLGLGSALTMLRIPYGSEASLEFTEIVTREMAIEGWRAALSLAKEKGPAPLLKEIFTVTAEMLRKRPEMVSDEWQVGDQITGAELHARYSRYMQRIAEVEPALVAELAKVGARFTHHSSIAPTGTIALSLANNASNGIEPSFGHHYSRNIIRQDRNTKEKVDVYSYELLAYRHWVDPDATPEASDSAHGLPDYFVTADQVTPKQHVDIQAASQKWIDSSISKTANVPTDYPFEDFKDIYRYAYHKGLKGCTTFRFNPAVFQGVLVKEKDLANTTYRFTLDDGSVVEARGNEDIAYEGQTHSAANLFDALKEGYYGKL